MVVSFTLCRATNLKLTVQYMFTTILTHNLLTIVITPNFMSNQKTTACFIFLEQNKSTSTQSKCETVCSLRTCDLWVPGSLLRCWVGCGSVVVFFFVRSGQCFYWRRKQKKPAKDFRDGFVFWLLLDLGGFFQKDFHGLDGISRFTFGSFPTHTGQGFDAFFLEDSYDSSINLHCHCHAGRGFASQDLPIH